MTFDKELLDFMKTEFRAGLKDFRQEVRAGFNELAQRIDQTNQRLDQTNQRLDQTNQRLDQTNQRLDSAILMVRDFRKDMSERLDGIGTYLRSIDGNVMRHEERLRLLEERVERLEDAC